MPDATAETTQQATALAPRQRGPQRLDLVEFQQGVEAKRAWITAVLPSTVDADRWVDLALYAISRQPKLMLCTPESLIRGMREAAALGLELGNVLGQATLLPFYNRRQSTYEAVFVPMYQGLLELAYRTGEVRDAEARVVYDCDEFTWEPSNFAPIFHRPALTRPATAKRLGAYFLAHLVNGGRVSEWMNAAEVEDIRVRGKAADDGPWVTDPDAMWRKTVTRRGIKYLPKSPEMRRALSFEDTAEAEATRPPAPRKAVVEDAHSRLMDHLVAPRAQDGQHGESDPEPTTDPGPAEQAPQGAEEEVEA